MKNFIGMLTLVVSSIALTHVAVAGGDKGTGYGCDKKYEYGKKPGLPVDEVKSDFAVMILGSGGPVAFSDGRAGSSFLFFIDGVPSLMMDSGSGSFKSLALSGASLKDVHHFMYTHMHIDHTSDISALLKASFSIV